MRAMNWIDDIKELINVKNYWTTVSLRETTGGTWHVNLLHKKKAKQKEKKEKNEEQKKKRKENGGEDDDDDDGEKWIAKVCCGNIR